MNVHKLEYKYFFHAIQNVGFFVSVVVLARKIEHNKHTIW